MLFIIRIIEFKIKYFNYKANVITKNLVSTPQRVMTKKLNVKIYLREMIYSSDNLGNL